MCTYMNCLDSEIYVLAMFQKKKIQYCQTHSEKHLPCTNGNKKRYQNSSLKSTAWCLFRRLPLFKYTVGNVPR